MFFSSLTPALREAADADGNGAISFAEAHWYASTQGDERNVTYTSIDALADDWFHAHADSAPRSLTVREVQALAAKASPAETLAARRLLAGFGDELALPLADLAGQATRWRPNSSQPRAMLGQLARRMLYLQSAAGSGPELARLKACENRSIAEFLAP